MKIICRVNAGDRAGGFEKQKVVVEIAAESLREAVIDASVYSDTGYIRIVSGGVNFDPQTLKVDCSGQHAASLLLNLEICKFISEQMPELGRLKYDKARRLFVDEGVARP